MRKYLIVTVVMATIIACNSEDSKKDPAGDKSAEKKTAGADISNNPDYQKGLELIGQSDCFTCHAVTGDRIQGPTYEEVANKYSDRPDSIIGYLAKKIITGGAGNWAETPLMTPHPTLSEEDAKAMVKYIMLLKK